MEGPQMGQYPGVDFQDCRKPFRAFCAISCNWDANGPLWVNETSVSVTQWHVGWDCCRSSFTPRPAMLFICAHNSPASVDGSLTQNCWLSRLCFHGFQLQLVLVRLWCDCFLLSSVSLRHLKCENINIRNAVLGRKRVHVAPFSELCSGKRTWGEHTSLATFSSHCLALLQRPLPAPLPHQLMALLISFKACWCCLLPQPPLYKQRLLLPPSGCTECLLLLWWASVDSSSAFTFPTTIPVLYHEPGHKSISQQLPCSSSSVIPQTESPELHQHLPCFCRCLNGNWEPPPGCPLQGLPSLSPSSEGGVVNSCS